MGLHHTLLRPNFKNLALRAVSEFNATDEKIKPGF
jgi:hypothetical protein